MTFTKIIIIAMTLSIQMTIGETRSETETNNEDQEALENRYQNTSLMAKTAKQRLGKKWSDEQRINNCKVPIEFRGSKSRPDKCYVAETN